MTCWRYRSLMTEPASMKVWSHQTATGSKIPENGCALCTVSVLRSGWPDGRRAALSLRYGCHIPSCDGSPMAKQRKWRILIADDEPAAHRGVRQLLAAFPQFTVAGECRNGAEVLAALDSVRPDVVFLDIQMPGVDGFEVIRRRTPERMPAVVVLTPYDPFALPALE